MKNPILKIENLSHRYTSSWAIKDINLEITQSGIVGLLGANGAGKSTTMNIMCGVLNQTDGIVFIDGIDIRQEPEKAKKLIGFLPQTPPLYQDLTVDEYLSYCAGLRLMEKQAIAPALIDAKERCGVSHLSKRLIRNLSGGYRQRVGIAQAIIHRPSLVVLDEPINGLDPNQIVEVRALIREIANDRAVIFSSHILSEVQLLCNQIKMIDNGRMVFADTMEAFNNYVQPHSAVLYLMNAPAEQDFLAIPGIDRVDFLNERQVRIFFSGGQDITGRLIELSVQKDWQLHEITLDKTSIDEIFSKLSKPSTAK
jgi:ABC-2 type transport system ATP-binding protein